VFRKPSQIQQFEDDMKPSNIPSCRLDRVALLTALAFPMYAADGVVLINQNAALAGNVTPGDAPGFPVTISVAGSYRLSGNLTVPDANTAAINLTADNVTIDLNGFSIVGPTACSGFPTTCSPTGTGSGITGGSLRNISILNGYIRGMGGRGVFLQGAGHLIKEIFAFSNGSDGISAFGIVRSCIANSNGGSGISTLGVAIDNVAIANGREGIEFTGQSGVGANNLASANKGNGLSGQATLTGNFALGNGQIGISAVCASSVVSNTAVNNVGGDIFTAGSGCSRANNAPAP
jgi:hypothetical protein